MPEGGNGDWQAVSGRALAFMCLTQAGLTEKGLAEQAQFLEDRLGLSRKEAAALLGSTPDSLKVLLRRSRKKQAKAKGTT